MVAASKGNLDVVTLLLRHGADPAQSAVDGSTAVSWALKFQHTDVAAFLNEHQEV